MPAPIHKQRAFLSAQRGMKKDLKQMFAQAQERMTAVLVRYAGADGKIPASAERDVTTRLEQIVSDLFTGGDNRSAYAQDGMTPLAPYPRILNKWIAWTTYEVVKSHAAWMQKRLPADVFRALHNARRRPMVSEQYAIFEPHPFASIDKARRWVHPLKWTDNRGYRLSDRIWRADMDTRARIDELLIRGLREGRGALDISRALEAYLVPSETGIRTLKPYGERFMPDGAAYSAIRLARTEITRAFSQAAFISAASNPYVTGMDWALSAAHPRFDICDGLATISTGGGRISDPYPLDAAPLPVIDSHPQCICSVSPVVTEDAGEVTERLRDYVQGGGEMNVNPANPENFTAWLLGAMFDQLTQQTVSNLLNIVF